MAKFSSCHTQDRTNQLLQFKIINHIKERAKICCRTFLKSLFPRRVTIFLKMRKILILAIAIISAIAAPSSFKKAEDCNSDNCKLPDCRCSSEDPPEGLDLSEIPQFVFLTFDDAITADHYEKFYSKALFDRKNPDGCPIGVTHFMSHQYTDYTLVHDLYLRNHEIALHSVTHSPYTDYWKNLTLEQETSEFGDEITMISYFANIPKEAVTGMRVPLLQLNGDNTFQAGKDLGLSYDCSWPTQTYRKPGLWPYTLDYESEQDCPIGPCPKSSIPGFWVVPMLDWKDKADEVCSMVDACGTQPTDEESTLQWYKDNFNDQYLGNKAPWGFYMHAAFFDAADFHFNAYIKFLDYLGTLPDVYIITVTRGVEWMKNPIPIGSENWPACPQVEDLGCTPLSCNLDLNGTSVYMTFCGTVCPDVYPWLNNPLGEL